ncbi:MAG: T9SS type A sorting domain-containing protein [Bacteroidales bacterium]|nr:T9SS type A sorting domain-containing protein [Bacteroidales bacterium]
MGDPNTWSGASTLGEDENGYVIWGKTGVNIGLIKLNHNGEQIWYKTWGDSIASWYVGYPGSLASINNEHYLAGSKNYYSPIEYDVGLLMKLNSNWDTIWTKEFDMNMDADPDTSTLINQMDICNNGDLVFGGGIYKPSIGSKFLLIRTDTAGNLLWFKTYSYSKATINDGYSVIQTSDSGFAIGGFWYIPGSSSATGDPIIIKTDSMGNQEWIKNLGGPIVDNRAMLCKANDGNIIMGTTIADILIGGTSTKSRINIVKLDNEGDILWNKKYGESSISNYLSTIRSLDDGSVICTGSVRSEIPWNSGWILKLSSEGDSLWYRQYYLLSGESTYNRLRDIISTSDSGYLACGYISPISPDTGIQSAWVIKLDSIGCDSAGCDTTVGITEEQGSGEAGKQGGMEIWPNPAKEIVNCQLSIVDSRSNCSLMIYDIFGREVTANLISSPRVGGGREGGADGREKGWQSWIVDVSSLPPGIYLAVVREGHMIERSAKFIIAR